MIQLNLNGHQRGIRILCLGSHSDDIEIGCGGTILRLVEQYPDCCFYWVVFSGNDTRAAEARQAAKRFVPEARLTGPVIKNFPDAVMPFVGAEVKEVFEGLKMVVSPDVIFTHNSRDAHQDHRLISDLTWNTFRDHLILEYEIPKYDGDLGRPSVFVPLTEEVSRAKVHYIVDSFPSQNSKRWFQDSTFLSLMRLRGMECNAPSGYAEAFYCRKLIL
jgi:LmbE family N-acetylglucosaminyl deacetylase